MIKQDLVDQVVMRTGVNRVNAEIAVDTIFGAMKEAMVRGERIELRGFGVFTVRERKGSVGRNPRTGETVTYAALKGIHFKPGKGLDTSIPPAGNAQKE